MHMLIFALAASASAFPGVHVYPVGDQLITYVWAGSVSQTRIEQSYKTDVPLCQEEVFPSDHETLDEYHQELVLCINDRLRKRGLTTVKARYSDSSEPSKQ